MTQYIIAVNRNMKANDPDAKRISEDAIAQITLEQCYSYPNWNGAIKVPACLFSAARLSKLVGENIHDFPELSSKHHSVKDKPFYL